MLEIIQIPVLNDNYIYLLHDSVSAETAVVDPALAEPILEMLAEKDWTLTHILNTHHHSDHVGGNQTLKQKTGCTIYGPLSDRHRIPDIDVTLTENDTVSIGTHKANIIDTPGHTSGHIVYHFGDNQALFCGDTLFVMGCGRLFEGTPKQMLHSLNKIKCLPGTTRVYCAHEYTQNNGQFALTVDPDNLELRQTMQQVNQLRARHLPTVPSTIAQELATNPFLRSDSSRLKSGLNMHNASALDVFTQTRALKDQF